MDYLQYKIINDAVFPTMRRIVPATKGSVHMSLRGLFSEINEAKKAIDNFELKRQIRKEAEQHGKTSRRRRSKQI